MAPMSPEVRRVLAEIERDSVRIDPRTAAMTWWYAQVVDPYGLDSELPDELDCVGRAYFLVDSERKEVGPVLVSDVRKHHPEISNREWDELMRAAAEREPTRSG